MPFQAMLPSSAQAAPAAGNWSVTPVHQPAPPAPRTSCRSLIQSAALAPASRTCRNCKQQFDPARNHPTACQYHPAHFGGETKRKFESVYAGGTMDTPASGEVVQYWHCCGGLACITPGERCNCCNLVVRPPIPTAQHRNATKVLLAFMEGLPCNTSRFCSVWTRLSTIAQSRRSCHVLITVVDLLLA